MQRFARSALFVLEDSANPNLLPGRDDLYDGEALRCSQMMF
jgi:hypothetical protein